MDCFEELANILNSAGMKLSELQSDDTELIKKLFIWSDLMQNYSKTNESSIRPFMNYLSVLYSEKNKEK